jgi:prepilin-type processing-associated H-X9-DG protein
MIPDRVGRAHTVFAVLLALAVPGGLLLHARASAYLDSQLAASAVTKALLALSQQTARERTEGAAALQASASKTAEADSVALLKVVDDYRELLQQKRFEQAWESIHPDAHGGWGKQAWVDAQTQLRKGDLSAFSEPWTLLLCGTGHQVVEVLTRGDTGFARVVMDLEDRSTVLLRKNGDGWAIDLGGTSDAQARSALGSQLDLLKAPNPFERVLGLTLSVDKGLGLPAQFPINALPAENYRQEAVSIRVEGDRARVDLLARGRAHLLVRVSLDRGNWRPTWDNLEIIDAGEPTSADAVGLRLASWSLASSCQANLKCIGLALMAYCMDNDEHMPIADRWCNQTLPYSGSEAVYRCPADDAPWSYAMNFKLSRQSMAKVVAPSATIAFFESEPSRRNAWDQYGQPGDSLATPPRHGEFNNFAFADGHVKSMRTSEVQPDLYRVVDNPEGVNRLPIWGAPPPLESDE